MPLDAVAQLNAALAGHYLIDREVGRGGMASVFLAQDIKHAVNGVVRLSLVLSINLTASRLTAQVSLRPSDREFWISAAVTLVAAAASDVPAHRFSTVRRSHALDRWAEIGDGLGAGRHVIGVMVASWVVACLTGRKEAARHVLHVAAAYTVGNVMVSALKPAVGRHRPDEADDAWRFRPFSAQGEWHAFPSAHAMHAFTLAAAATAETKSHWVAAASFGAATLVAWSRVYRLEHWPSDVAGAAVLGIVSAQTTIDWIHR